MVTLSDEQVSQIKTLQQEIVNKLNQALGTQQSNVPGTLLNQYAPCLIGHCIGDVIGILHIINQSEGK